MHAISNVVYRVPANGSGATTPFSTTSVAGTLSPARDSSPSSYASRRGRQQPRQREASWSGAGTSSVGGGTPPGAERRRPNRQRTYEARLLDSKYVLGEELGRGSSGKVYRALNKVAGQIVAIKEIPLVGMSKAAARAVQSEVELLHRLQHPRIVRFYETIRTAEHLYLVLEYVENGSLGGFRLPH